MTEFTVKQIGKVWANGGECRIVLEPEYASAMQGLNGFSHVNVLWWFSGCDNDEMRKSLTEESPYKTAPPILGTFATRSPMRPNPIALSCAQIIYIDHGSTTIGLAWIDAEDGSPVLDIKPYTPSLDRVESPGVPHWCAHWPKSCEESGSFDWEHEFKF